MCIYIYMIVHACTYVFQDLAEEIGPSARVIQLEGDSSNLISVIQTSYNVRYARTYIIILL